MSRHVGKSPGLFSHALPQWEPYDVKQGNQDDGAFFARLCGHPIFQAGDRELRLKIVG